MSSSELDTTVHFDVHTINNGHVNCTYRGIPFRKSPFDQCLYQMLIYKVKPDLVIEIGTKEGATALYIADIMDKIGKGVVHSIDKYITAKDEVILENPRIQLFDGGFRSYDVSNIFKDETVLVIDDGHNTYEEVRDSLSKLAPFVTPGSYFIVEDGIINQLGLQGYNGGPIRAIAEYLGDHPEFVVDKNYTNMFGRNATFNVAGYLKRIS